MKRLVAVLTAALVGCAAEGPQGPAATSQIPPGKSVHQLVVDGVEREFVLHVPDTPGPLPVVFMLHGTSGNGDRFHTISGWAEKADEEGFIAVFPSALSYCLGDDDNLDGVIQKAEWTVTTKWATGALGTGRLPLCPADIRQTKRAAETVVRDDVAFIDAIVAWLDAHLPVDPDRRFVTGFSNGGQMSARLMVERSTVFAAFSVAAGSLDVDIPGAAERPPPVAFSVGSLDDRFLAMTGLPELPVDDTLATTPVLSAIVGRMAIAAGLDTEPHTFEAKQVGGKSLGVTTLASGPGNHLVAVIIEDATHEYPNGKNHPVSMPDLLWPFFLSAASSI